MTSCQARPRWTWRCALETTWCWFSFSCPPSRPARPVKRHTGRKSRLRKFLHPLHPPLVQPRLRWLTPQIYPSRTSPNSTPYFTRIVKISTLSSESWLLIRMPGRRRWNQKWKKVSYRFGKLRYFRVGRLSTDWRLDIYGNAVVLESI